MSDTDQGTYEAPAGHELRPAAPPMYAAPPGQPVGILRDPRMKSPAMAAVPTTSNNWSQWPFAP